MPCFLHGHNNLQHCHCPCTMEKAENGDKSQIIPFYRTSTNLNCCLVFVVLHIYHRALHLKVKPSKPLVVCALSNGAHLFVANSIVAFLLQYSTCIVFHMGYNDYELAKWTTHSICITTAKLLHQWGFANSLSRLIHTWKELHFLCIFSTLSTQQKHISSLC